MIIKLLFELVIGLINLIPFSIPSLPSDVNTYITTFNGYISSGVGMVKFFLPFEYCKILLEIILAIIVSIELYKFVMWILRKIPMLGMKE